MIEKREWRFDPADADIAMGRLDDWLVSFIVRDGVVLVTAEKNTAVTGGKSAGAQ